MLGTGTVGDPYIIQNVTDLQAVGDGITYAPDAYYELEGNIDASATSGWNAGAGFEPLPLFTGSFDGKNFNITDLTINRPTTNGQALFGSVTGVVKNTHLTNVSIAGQFWVGSLVSYLEDGEIDNCSSSGSIVANFAGGLIGHTWKTVTAPTIINSHCSCTVTSVGGANTRVAGFIYLAIDTVITNCYATGNAINDDVGGGGPATPFMAAGFVGIVDGAIISRCYATGNAVTSNEAWRRAGGFVSEIEQNFSAALGSISNCYARGSVVGGGGFINDAWDGTIDNCYSTGEASTDSGFCSRNTATISDCFWDTETSTQALSDGGTGKTTAEMKTQATFTDAGWDFATPVWYIYTSYPVLEEIENFISDPLLRVSGIERTFTSGVGGTPIYQMVLLLGGLSSYFASPVSSIKPETSINLTQQQPDLSRTKYGEFLIALQTNPNFVLGYGNVPSYEEWLRIMRSSI